MQDSSLKVGEFDSLNKAAGCKPMTATKIDYVRETKRAKDFVNILILKTSTLNNAFLG